MNSLVRLIVPLIVAAALFVPNVSANEGGDGGNDAVVTQPGAKAKKNANCQELANLERELDKAKKKARESRDVLRIARNGVEHAPRDLKAFSQRTLKMATADYEAALEQRDELQRRYDKLRRACL